MPCDCGYIWLRRLADPCQKTTTLQTHFNKKQKTTRWLIPYVKVLSVYLPCSCIKKLPTKKYFYQLYRIILPPHITNSQKSESANVIIDSMPCHPCLSGLQQFVAKCQNLVPKQLLVHHSTMSRTIKLEKAYTS